MPNKTAPRNVRDLTLDEHLELCLDLLEALYPNAHPEIKISKMLDGDYCCRVTSDDDETIIKYQHDVLLGAMELLSGELSRRIHRAARWLKHHGVLIQYA